MHLLTYGDKPFQIMHGMTLRTLMSRIVCNGESILYMLSRCNDCPRFAAIRDFLDSQQERFCISEAFRLKLVKGIFRMKKIELRTLL